MSSLGDAGQRLFDGLVGDSDPEPVRRLALEAARLADRLDKLDLLVRGDVDSWSYLTLKFEADEVARYELVINAAVAEARQNATVLKGLIVEVDRLRPASEDTDDDDCAV